MPQIAVIEDDAPMSQQLRAWIEAAVPDARVAQWFTRDEAIEYQLTRKGEPFRGREVSLNSVSDLLVKLAVTPGLEVRQSLGVSRGERTPQLRRSNRASPRVAPVDQSATELTASNSRSSVAAG